MCIHCVAIMKQSAFSKKPLWIVVKMSKATHLRMFVSKFQGVEGKKTFTWKLLFLQIYIVTEIIKMFARYFRVLSFVSRRQCSSFTKIEETESNVIFKIMTLHCLFKYKLSFVIDDVH